MEFLKRFVVGMSVFGFGMYSAMFCVMALGHSIYEPNKIIAVTEAILSAVLCLISFLVYVSMLKTRRYK
uniref:Uncharacterized protein n=1 Tax=viral metagenome TaxID=1070528 RepID=A0A6H2A1B2_9ZZZZ